MKGVGFLCDCVFMHAYKLMRVCMSITHNVHTCVCCLQCACIRSCVYMCACKHVRMCNILHTCDFVNVSVFCLAFFWFCFVHVGAFCLVSYIGQRRVVPVL